MTGPNAELDLLKLHRTPWGWPLRVLRIPQAHKITRGRPDVIVAVIDLGYRLDPKHKGRLWVNPNATQGATHGWDCFDDDASLEYHGEREDTPYYRGHHAFVMGEVIACAPRCRVMAVRVGYGKADSWWKGVNWAVEHGAKILVIPHGFLTHGRGEKQNLFELGSDFSYPIDNPRKREALEAAHDAGCLIVRGTADNRGRRVAAANSAIDPVMAVGSCDKRGEAADICDSADYVEAAAPGGRRDRTDPLEQVWGTDGAGGYMPFTGGCMAAGFAGGVAALVWSRFPQLTHDQLRQVLRNTAGGEQWDRKLGWGVLDAATAVRLDPKSLSQDLRIDKKSVRPVRRKGRPVLTVTVRNRGAFDVRRALLVAFNGDPIQPPRPDPKTGRAAQLTTRQIGHAIAPVRGLHGAVIEIELIQPPGREVWLQLCSLDLHGSAEVETARTSIA